MAQRAEAVSDRQQSQQGRRDRRRPSPAAAGPTEAIIRLQRQAGNAAMSRLVQVMRSGASPGADGSPNLAAMFQGAGGGGSALPGLVRQRLQQGLGAELGQPVAGSDVGGGLAVSHPADAIETAAEETAPRLASGTATVGAKPVLQSEDPGCGPRLCVQRHASDEHLALGELPPGKLAGIADARDLYRALAAKSQGAVKLNRQKDPTGVIRTSIHLLQSERARIRLWQEAPPEQSGVYGDGVRVIKIPTSDGTVFGTYGELNTLPDYFGNTEDLRALSSEHMTEVLQTLRQEYYDWLGKFLLELTERDFVVKKVTVDTGMGPVEVERRFYRGEPLQPEKVGPQGKAHSPDEYMFAEGSARLQHQTFKGSQTGIGLGDALHPIAGASSFLAGMKGASVPVDLDAGVQARGTGGAWGSLARNACHFVPFSWDAWRQYHLTALKLAAEANGLRKKKADLEVQLGKVSDNSKQERIAAQIAEKEQQAAQKEDAAFVENGFGDHYLQDSFAAGHLMNKTLVMQWFMEYIGKNWKLLGPSTGGEWERLMTMSSERQEGMSGQSMYSKQKVSSPDPQAVANVAEKKGRKAAYEQSGLEVPEFSDNGVANAIVGSWMADSDTREAWLTVTDIHKKVLDQGIQGVRKNKVATLLEEMVAAGFILKGRAPTQWFAMTYKLNLASTLLKNMKDQEKNDPDKVVSVEHPLESMLMGNYEEWLYSSTVQMGSKVLHDYFCKRGLDVYDDKHESVYRIYGDYELLAQGASKGVRFASETAHLSQQDIANRVQDGKSADSIADIYDRFPRYAVVPPSIQSGNKTIKLPNAGSELRLDEWLKDLKEHLMELFGSELTSKEIYGSRTAAKSPTSRGTMFSHEGAPF